MDIATTQDSREHDMVEGASRPRPLRIYAAHPLMLGSLAGWDEQIARIASLGFDHLLIAPPFMTGEDGDLFLTAQFDRIDPRIVPGATEALPVLSELAQACRRHGLRLLLDVVLDRLSASAPLAATRPDLIATVPADAALDPRHGAGPPGTALFRSGEQAWIEWWVRRLRDYASAGIAGVRLLGLSAAPPQAVAALAARVRPASPAFLLLGWAAGLSEQARAALPALDGVAGSLAWWDFAAGWFWQELASLARRNPVLAAPCAPFETGMPSHAAAARRLLRFGAGMGEGWLVAMGAEYGLARPLDAARGSPEDWRALVAAAPYDLSAEIAALNDSALLGASAARPLETSASGAVVVLRADHHDPRRARSASLVVANPSLERRARIHAGRLLTAQGALLPDAESVGGGRAVRVRPGEAVTLEAGEVLLLRGAAQSLPNVAERTDLAAAARQAAAAPRIAIEAVEPAIDDGAFPVKRIVGDQVIVSADIVFDGHDVFAASLLWQPESVADWREVRMRPLGNDRWEASFPLAAMGRHLFTIEAWRDAFGTWRDEVAKKYAAGVDTSLELREGRALVQAHAKGGERALDAVLARLDTLDADAQRTLLLSSEVEAAMAAADPRPHRVRHEPALVVEADRPGAAFASWYEVFPRSLSDDPVRHGDFDDVIRHMPRVRDMGFDVLYFPPIHPIGRKNRKGRNNSLTPTPDDPGSPYAIGSDEGGHDAVHPQLGTLEDFRRMVAAAAEHGLEIAIDFAIQCSPDHPWLRQHKDWFAWRPDGSIKYAENPPKKYQDIVNVDFYAAGAIPGLWVALCEVVLFWCEQGVRLFRVDNPHTKPLPFWEWMIGTVRARHPDAVFLAEAFTRPKVMYRLAKVGFGQSYTYFTWRNTKSELTAYLTELATTAPRDFFRPHFFVNTPDINPPFLQTGGRPAHLIRAALAATLSGLWGVYNGFELCEATPLPGREEYLDSEKYQLRAWDWQRPGNIVGEITTLNRIRRENPALQTHLGVEFHNAASEAILWYEKATEDRSNVVLIAVSLDPFNAQEALCEAPLWNWGLPDDAALEMENLTTGDVSIWRGKAQRLALTPERPYGIWRARPLP